MMRTIKLSVFAMIFTGTALAHTGVENPAVQARMHAMTMIGDEMKILGQMAKGATGFDRNAAQAAASSIANYAAKTPGLFEAREDDPKSEAKSEIWDSFEDFTAKSERLETLARDLSTRINEESDLAPAMKSLGETCQACHKAYRE